MPGSFEAGLRQWTNAWNKTPGRSPGPRPRTKSSRSSPPTANELTTQDTSWGHSRISGIVQGWTVAPATCAGLLPIRESYRVSVHNHRSWSRAHLRHRSVRVPGPEGCEPVLTATWPSQRTAQRRAAASPLQHRAGLGRPYVAHPGCGQLQADAGHRLADERPCQPCRGASLKTSSVNLTKSAAVVRGVGSTRFVGPSPM